MSDLAREILSKMPSRTVRIAYGVMASATTVNIEGDTTAVEVPQLASAGLLSSGDYVALQVVGADVLIIGRVGAPMPSQFVNYTPPSNLDATSTGTTTVWLTLGNITVPAGATNATITMSLSGIYCITSANTQYQLYSRLNLVLGDAITVSKPEPSSRFAISWTDRIAVSSSGTQSLQLAAQRNGGSGQWRADSTSRVTAHVVFD